MDREKRDAEKSGSEAPVSDRREFLAKSLGAAPIVLTVGKGHGWGGKSGHGTLWSSSGTDWKHRGRKWWRGKDWDKWGDGPDHDSHPDWEWQSSGSDWRKWRPDEDEGR
jgi:hypothetical protein